MADVMGNKEKKDNFARRDNQADETEINLHEKQQSRADGVNLEK